MMDLGMASHLASSGAGKGAIPTAANGAFSPMTGFFGGAGSAPALASSSPLANAGFGQIAAATPTQTMGGFPIIPDQKMGDFAKLASDNGVTDILGLLGGLKDAMPQQKEQPQMAPAPGATLPIPDIIMTQLLNQVNGTPDPYGSPFSESIFS